MEPNYIVIFVGLTVASCIVGGAIYSGLAMIAAAIRGAK